MQARRHARIHAHSHICTHAHTHTHSLGFSPTAGMTFEIERSSWYQIEVEVFFVEIGPIYYIERLVNIHLRH